MLKTLNDWFKAAFCQQDERMCSVPRSSRWPAVSKDFLKGKICEACGGTEELTCHHVIPVGVDRSHELDTGNLVVLCEKNQCHRTWGHFGNWQHFNPNVRENLIWWKEQRKNVKLIAPR